MARKPRAEYAGAFYHVIVRGNQRQVIFGGDTDRRYYLERLEEYRQRYGTLSGKARGAARSGFVVYPIIHSCAPYGHRSRALLLLGKSEPLPPPSSVSKRFDLVP
jgi:hypothetical protein